MLSQWIGSSLMLPVARQDSSAPFFSCFFMSLSSASSVLFKLPSVPLLPPPVLLFRSWKTGSRLCLSTRSWGSLCLPSWMSCTTVSVNSTGPKTSLPTRARISARTPWQPLRTSLPWPTGTPRWSWPPSHPLSLSCCVKTAGERRNSS